ncbi:MAG: putative transposase [Glaciecola sp.]|jgi:putative transposase
MKVAPKNREDKMFSIDVICDAFSLKRDAYYKYSNRYLAKQQLGQTVV